MNCLKEILSGKSVRSVVLESMINVKDYESISNEREFESFKGKLALFSPEFKLTDANPQYNGYSFKVYCSDLIGSIYDADDPHPLEITIYLSKSVNPDELPFKTAMQRMFDSGADVRTILKFMTATGESVFKQMKFKKMWREN